MHTRKKGGVRKDKKVARMRATEELKQEDRENAELNKKLDADQDDVVSYKKGSRGDRMIDPTIRHSKKAT